MSNEILNTLLKEYDQKKLKAELEAEERKKALYEKFPRLQQIENELNSFAIQTAKNILNTDSTSKLEKEKELQEKVEKLKFEKVCILQEHNLDANYLKPFYECPFCQDTGYIVTGNSKSEMCKKKKKKLLDISFNKSNMSNLDKENFDTFNENIFSDEVDISKYRYNISPRTNIRNIKQKCIEFVENFDNPNYKNLLFSGNTGLR